MGMIAHSVLFKLKYDGDTPYEKKFLQAAHRLARIPGVQNLHCYRQTNKKNRFDFGIAMEFASQEAYEIYNKHPQHIDFIKEFWIPRVQEFLEIDYEPIAPIDL